MSRGNAPDTAASLHIFGGGHVVEIRLDACTLDFLDLLNDLVVNAVFIYDVAVGVAHGDDLATQLGGLLVGVGGNVAGAGDDYALALKGLVPLAWSISIGEVAQAVAGCLEYGPGSRRS